MGWRNHVATHTKARRGTNDGTIAKLIMGNRVDLKKRILYEGLDEEWPATQRKPFNLRVIDAGNSFSCKSYQLMLLICSAMPTTLSYCAGEIPDLHPHGEICTR
jgi:hypothetical protein